MIKLQELLPHRQLNELSLKSMGNRVKTILNKVAIKKGKKDAEDLQQSDIAAAVPSTSLKKYLGQLKAIISPLYALAIAGDQEQTEACRAIAMEMGILKLLKGSADFNSPEGNFASDKYHAQKLGSSVEAIKDLMYRMQQDMKKEVAKLDPEGAASFSVEDAIEMLYFKYSTEKSALVTIARGIQKTVGGFMLDGRIFRVLQNQLRKAFPGESGRLLNSVMADFIGSIAGIASDYGGKACSAYFDGIRKQINYYTRAFGDQGAPNGGYKKFWDDGDIDWNITVRCLQRCEASAGRNYLPADQIYDRKKNLGIAGDKYRSSDGAPKSYGRG